MMDKVQKPSGSDVFDSFCNMHFSYCQVAKATYASIGLLILYFSLKPKKKPAPK
jgi:hypothetical protein